MVLVKTIILNEGQNKLWVPISTFGLCSFSHKTHY